MLVVATEPGFYGYYRAKGDQFELPDDELDVTPWVEPVGVKPSDSARSARSRSGSDQT